ncbi:RHS repeat protein [Chryseobacterium indologenes]|uniref:RHS repeat protein n=1 Tax=Chryseobacterium indologenes TaxID=253 RepID=UPI001BCAD0E9|nr:RHS repeat protein [Chryseobacterium indologenes]
MKKDILKKFIVLGLLFISLMYYGQASNSAPNTGVTRPVPTISSLATYNNVPVSIQTGIPDISYNLFSVPSNSKSFGIDMGISYHPVNATDEWIGDLGRGWSLFGQGVISREIIGEFDEHFTLGDSYLKNYFDDVYNYTIPGESGKFRFIRDTSNNTFKLVKLTSTSSTINYQRSVSNTSTLVVDSFTIITDKGIKYKFEIYGLSRARVMVHQYPNGGILYGNQNYRSAFFLTSVEDESGNILAAYNYLKDVTHPIGEPDVVESEEYKLTDIEVKSQGLIKLEYDKINETDLGNIKADKFRLKSASLKTVTDQFISKYTFQTGLESFAKVDVNNNEIEKTKFKYGGITFIQEPNTDPNPELVIPTTLGEVQLPSGGTIKYAYDFIPFNYIEEPKIIVPEENLGNVSFTTINSIAKKKFFTVPVNNGGTPFPNKPYYVAIDINAGQLANNYWSLAFYKKVGSSYQPVPISLGPAVEPDPDYPTRQLFPFYNTDAGDYYVSLLSAEPGITIPFGEVYFEAKHLGEPVETIVRKPSSTGQARIATIKYYNEVSSSIQTGTIPAKVEEYNYNKFDNPTESSGLYVAGGNAEDGLTALNPVILYQNVKISGGTDGYTKYYFKTPYDYTLTQLNSLPFWPNFSIMRSGLLTKKEIYNALNGKVSDEAFDYTFMEYDAPEYLPVPSGVVGNFYIKTVWIKDHTSISRNYFNSGITETKKAVFNNTNNYRPNLEKVTSFDGNIQEVKYKYALDKNNQKLITANMIGIPLETETTQTIGTVTKILSKTETKYDNPLNLLPSSVLSTDLQNVTSTEVTYDQYDLKGNLQQYTTKDGISTVIIWGYNQTQPIAKIEGAKLTDIQQSLIDSIVNASDTDALAASGNDETAFLSALSSFRANTSLSGYQITTYTYDPLVGVRSITSPSGIRESYVYDSANRLEKVIDVNGKVLKEMKYNYKN